MNSEDATTDPTGGPLPFGGCRSEASEEMAMLAHAVVVSILAWGRSRTSGCPLVGYVGEAAQINEQEPCIESASDSGLGILLPSDKRQTSGNRDDNRYNNNNDNSA
jgi:hypothetical protein